MKMSSSPVPHIQTDAEGLILPKKLVNPCLENVDRKELHREMKFNNKTGKSVLNKKSELQLAYEKQRDKLHLSQIESLHKSDGNNDLKSELSRVIMERSQKQLKPTIESEQDEEKQYVNTEYLNVRAKLRTGQHIEMK